MESDNLSVTVGSTSYDYEEEEEQELKIRKKKKKFNKLRSIKLSKSPSSKPSTRRSKSHFRNILVDSENSPCSTSSSSSSTSRFSRLSDARTDISKKLGRRSSFKGVKSLTRMSSKKLRKPMMSRFSQGDEVSQMTNCRSARPVNSNSNHDQSSVISTPSSSSSGARKMRFQASPCTPESQIGQKSARSLTRKASFKPLRASTKSKRGSVKVHPNISEIADSSVERATCSSTLKDSKFPSPLQLQQGGSEAEGISTVKVCPFSYCSLHGHRHTNVPPLKRLISIRRRMLRQDNRPVRRGKSSGNNAKKRIPKKVVEDVDREFSSELNAGPEDAESNGCSSYGEEDAKFSKSSSLSEALVGETSYPLSYIEENLNQAPNEVEKPDSETSDKEEEEFVASEQEEGDSNEPTRPTPDEDVETTSKIGASFGSHSELENEQEAANKEEKENLEPDHGFLRFPPRVSEPKSPSNAAPRMQLKDQKYVRMWRLMYKHAVKGVPGEAENQPPLDGVHRTEEVRDAQVLVESNISRSSQDSSEGDDDNKQMELEQIDAVKLVQEAFDQILLPEIQELSSDDRSVTSGIGSDHETFEQDQVDGKERIIGTESISSLKEEKTSSKGGDKPNQKVSKSWSNLKKILVLKRFVKALDKVKKINRGTPRYLLLQPEPEAEKIHLRRQMSEERKNAEEWMLDFALQQVISKLDPEQQRKVAIMVKAFETVLPLPDLKSSPNPNIAAHCTKLVEESDERNGEVSAEKTSATTKRGNDHADQVSDFLKAEPQEEMKSPKIKESKVILPSDRSDSFSTFLKEKDSRRSFYELNEDDTRSTHDEVPHNGNVEEVQKQPDVSTNSERGNEVCDVNLESGDVISGDNEQMDTSKNRSFVDDAEPIREKDDLESEFAPGSPPSEESESDVAQDTQLEKQSYMRLWGFVYKHMMTGVAAANEGTDQHDTAEEEKADDTKMMSMPDIPASGQSFAEKGQDTSMEDGTADNQKEALRRFEAIKLIEKAIDEILLPENQDNAPGGQIIPDEVSQGKKIPLERKSVVSDSTDPANESFRQSGKIGEEQCGVPECEERGTISSDTTVQEEQKMSSNKQMPRSWSNLKKMILLKRFIKALENVRKFNPRGPRFLPLDADPEAEKVNLKHLEMDERRNAEEWMLDYALQQAVTRLTPARKRKVKLLVEAFETIRS